MDLELELAFELGRVSRRWRTRLDERLKHTGQTQARWMALLQLSRSGPVSQRELAERVGVEGPTLVRLLDNLEEQGLIERQACEDDRRVKLVHLTPAADPVLKEITRISAELRHELLADVPQEKLRIAHEVMKLIGDRLEGPST